MSKIGQFEINWCFLSTKNEKFSFVENQPMKVLSVAASQLDCKTVRIFAYSSTREQSNKRSGSVRLARVRLLRHASPISLLILRKKSTVLQSTSQRYI